MRGNQLHILHRIFLHFQAQQLFFGSSFDNHHHNLDYRVSTWKMQTIRNLLYWKGLKMISLYTKNPKYYLPFFFKFQHWSKFLLGHGCRLHSRSSDPAPAHSIRWMPSTPAAGPRIHTWSLDLDCKPPAHDWLQGVHAEYGSHWQTPIQYIHFMYA